MFTTVWHCLAELHKAFPEICLDDSTCCSKAVVSNLFKPKIPDFHLGERQDLPIEALKEKDSPDCTSNLTPFIQANCFLIT